jgi:2-polyprenyl-6-methoxyphenol hydroxylase-like FAD-dependent oxidoreductase
VASFPTNDELSVVFQALTRDRFDAFRRDVEPSFLTAADRCGDLGERLRSGRRVERIRTTPDLPHELRVQHGRGWVLAGDAGAVMHPLTAHGITHALRDADRIAAAIVAGLADPPRLDVHLREAWRRRDREIRPVFDGTAQLARLAGLTPTQRALLAATGEDPDLAAAFIASFTGASPWQDMMTPMGAVRHLGARGVLAAARQLADPGTARYRRPYPFPGR